jgi:hypothetical protein
MLWHTNDQTIALSAAAFFVTFVAGAAEPVFVTSEPNGGWPEGGYYVHNNLWNSAKYSPCTSTLYASSHSNWYVVARMNNKTGDGAVKTYPNVHRDYDNVPISAFDSLTSSFAETSPHVGIYNVTYDSWINGIATAGCTEIMIWTENFRQTPGGRYVEDVTFGERTYKVYKRASSGYIAFVATTNFTSGTLDLLEIMKWSIAKGWFSRESTLNQICFGFETVSTDDKDARFQVSAFSIAAKLRPKPDLTAAPCIRGEFYRCGSMVRAVNDLRRLGKEQALATLRSHLSDAGAGGDPAEREKLLMICRVLFVNPAGWHPPRLGHPEPEIDPESVKLFPLFPIAMAHNVPFLLVRGYASGGYSGDTPEKCVQSCQELSLIPSDLPEKGFTEAAYELIRSPQFKKLYPAAKDIDEVSKMILAQAQPTK